MQTITALNHTPTLLAHFHGGMDFTLAEVCAGLGLAFLALLLGVRLVLNVLSSF